MNWIETKEKHFVDFFKDENGEYWLENNNCPDNPFLVAVKTNKGWDIDYVVLTENGLEAYTEDSLGYYGWNIDDVTHWMPIKEPQSAQNSQAKTEEQGS